MSRKGFEALLPLVRALARADAERDFAAAQRGGEDMEAMERELSEAEPGSTVHTVEVDGATYTVIVEPAKAGYGAYFPEVLGCTSSGATIGETLSNAAEALTLHLELDREQ